MPHHDDLSPALKALLDDAIDECIRAKESTNFQFPFVLIDAADGKELSVIVNDQGNQGDVLVAAAREKVRQSRNANAYVVAYDATLKSKEGKDVHAFVLESGEKLQSEGFVFHQRYQCSDDGEVILVFGPNGFLNRSEQLLK